MSEVQLYVHERSVHFPYFIYARRLHAYARKNNAAVGITLSAGTRLSLFFHSETIVSHVLRNNLEYKKQRATEEMYQNISFSLQRLVLDFWVFHRVVKELDFEPGQRMIHMTRKAKECFTYAARQT